MLRRSLATVVTLFVLVAVTPLLAACGDSDSSSDGSSGETTSTTAQTTSTAPVCQARGPNGEKPTPVEDLKITPAQLAKIRDGGYTAAIAMHTSDEVSAAVIRGAESAFGELGIEVVATTSAGYQADRQSEQIRTILAKRPDIIVSLPVDPTATAAAFKQAAAAGTTLVFEDNAPTGFTRAGDNYVSVISSDHCEMGEHAADALATAIGGEGEIGYIYHDADFYVTNNRDSAFKKAIEQKYPNIDIVAEQGIADPAQAEAQANAMLTQHPNLKGIYVTFGEVALGVLSGLRNNGNTTTRIATMDLAEPLAIDMANDGPTAAMVVEGLFDDGAAMARAGALSLIGEQVAPFIVSPATTVTKDNLVEGYQASEHTKPSDDVLDALGN
jgi:ribose transport system substrate-binding protein